jgi:chorismate-pyruvate lyase
MKTYTVKILKTLLIKANTKGEAYAKASEWLERNYRKIYIAVLDENQ